MTTLALFPGSLHERPLHCNGLAQDVITFNNQLFTMMVQNNQANVFRFLDFIDGILVTAKMIRK